MGGKTKSDIINQISILMVYLRTWLKKSNTKLNKPLTMPAKRSRFALTFVLCICTYAFFTHDGMAQTVETQNHWEKLNNRILDQCPDMQYSFQLQVSDQVRAYPSIPGNLCELVTNNRKQTQTHFHYLSDLVRIKIFSEQEWKQIKANESRTKPLIHTSF